MQSESDSLVSLEFKVLRRSDCTTEGIVERRDKEGVPAMDDEPVALNAAPLRDVGVVVEDGIKEHPHSAVFNDSDGLLRTGPNVGVDPGAGTAEIVTPRGVSLDEVEDDPRAQPLAHIPGGGVVRGTT